ncbi:30S ribosomal protein S3 [bacterium]|nr:30S ribosomal protein S3 [bacterium]
MAHKVHPKAYRVGYIADWDSRWFTDKSFAKNLEEDFKIRQCLEKKLKDAALERIEIERSPGKINIIIHTARPGLVIGRAGKGLEILKHEIEEKILKQSNKAKEKIEVRFDVKEIRNPWSSAQLVAQWVAQRLEKRVPYRTVLKQALSKIQSYKDVQGAKIEVSGRLNGVTIARKEWLQYGRLPRQTIRADIDYGFAQAYCTYGVIGVKVWLYKGEKFEVSPKS